MRSPGCELATRFMACCWRVHPLVVDVREHVARPQPGGRGGSGHLLELHGRAVDAEAGSLRGRQVVRLDDAEIAANHAAVLDELLHHAAHEVHRDREAETLGRRLVARRGADDAPC